MNKDFWQAGLEMIVPVIVSVLVGVGLLALLCFLARHGVFNT
jgi:hypothetical protein